MAETRLIGSYWTLAVGAGPEGQQHCSVDLRTRVEAAARAGYTGMGFWHADLEAISAAMSFAEMKAILDGNGIVDVEVEWLLDWYCTDGRRIRSDATRALLFEAAEALDARHIKVGDLGNDCADVPEMTEHFALLCHQAAERGTVVLFEMLPPQFSRAPSLQQALSLVRGTGANNAGLMLDNLHLLRCGHSIADLTALILPDDRLGVEINDGMLAMPIYFEDSVINKRLLPGDGEFDIDGFLRTLWQLGYDGPVGVEVLNEYMRLWNVDVAAEQSFIKTRRVVDRSRIALP